MEIDLRFDIPFECSSAQCWQGFWNSEIPQDEQEPSAKCVEIGRYSMPDSGWYYLE